MKIVTSVVYFCRSLFTVPCATASSTVLFAKVLLLSDCFFKPVSKDNSATNEFVPIRPTRNRVLLIRLIFKFSKIVPRDSRKTLHCTNNLTGSKSYCFTCASHSFDLAECLSRPTGHHAPISSTCYRSLFHPSDGTGCSCSLSRSASSRLTSCLRMLLVALLSVFIYRYVC